MTLATVQDPIVISQYEVLLGDIAEAKSVAVTEFEYETKEGDKAARSYLFQLRKLRARIESARKDAKSYALAYGKRVDEQAKELSSQVDELIQPHQEQLEAIARREAARTAAHEAVLNQATGLGQVFFGDSSTTIHLRLDQLDAISLDGLEEFTDRVAGAIVTSRQALQQALQQALAAEEQAAELARLKAEQEQREAQERQAQIQREAQERADAEAAAAAADAIAAAEKRAAAAEAALARQQAIDAARDQEEADKTVRAMHLEELEAAVGPLEVPDPPAIEISDKAVASLSAVVQAIAQFSDRVESELRIQLQEALAGKNRLEVVDALVAGTLHPAITINWEAVK